MTIPLQTRALRHGHTSNGNISPTYQSWSHMKRRCTDPNVKAWKDYGGRGIKVCDRWLESFENFLADMGEKPPGLTLDRKNNDGSYEPSNCRWATREEQAINKRRNGPQLSATAERDIVARMERGELVRLIAAHYGINKNTPTEIWKRLRPGVERPRHAANFSRRGPRINEAKVSRNERIVRLRHEGKTQKHIADVVGVSESLVRLVIAAGAAK